MHASEILNMLHTLFLQQISPSKGSVPNESTCIVSWLWSFAILSVCEPKENAVTIITHAFGAFAGILLLQFTVSTVYCFCRYRKVVSNVCEGGVDLQQNLAHHMCPLIAPKGLQINIREESLAVRPGEDITFIVRQEQVVMNVGYMEVESLILGLVSFLPVLLLNED